MSEMYNRFGTNAEAGCENLPAKKGIWNSFKNVLFKEVKVELTPGQQEFEDNLNEYLNQDFKVTLTPAQQKFEDDLNEFLHQEITWPKVRDFLFQEVHIF